MFKFQGDGFALTKELVYKELEGADHGFFDADETEAIRILLGFCKQ